MSFATLCAGLALRVGVQATEPWFTSDDLTAQEIAAFVQEGLRQVAGDGDWTALLREASWTATGDAVQAFSLPADVDRIVPDTVWGSGRRVRAFGPATAAGWETWQRDGVGHTASPVWVLEGRTLRMRGTVAGETITARYRTTTLTKQGGASFLADNDAAVLDERLIGMASEMLYRDAKGLPAGAASRYPVELDKARGADRPVGVLSLGRGRRGRSSGGVVSINSTDAVVVLQ